MTMLSEFNTRIPEQRRVELSNRTDNPDATTQDDTVVNVAIADVAADFITYAGVVLDLTTPDAQLVAHGILGIVLYLEAYKGDSMRAWEKVRDWQKKALDQGVRKTKGNNRIKPKSSSKLTPADENPSGGIVRPDFDLNESFDDFVPGRQNRGRRFN